MALSSVEITSLILEADRNIRSIEFAVKQIEKNAVNEYKKRLQESKNFVDIEDYDILTEKRGDDGVRRYDVKNTKDGFVMLPNKNGFWSPYLDLTKAT